MAQEGPWHLEKSQARAEIKKHIFPVLGVPKQNKKVTTLSGMVVRNFFTLYILADRTPRGGKSQNTGIVGHFGLGRPLVLRLKKSRARAENEKKHNFPALGVPESKKKSYHAIRDGCPQFFSRFTFCLAGPPRTRNCKYGFLRPFWPRTTFGT